jgi:enoyl-CoA hydratase/carnithine racemase
MSEQRVSIERRGHVAVVTLTRPEKRNALDPASFDALDAAARELSADRELRAVVLAGAGKSFCAGIDLMSFAAGEAVIRKLLARRGDEAANLAQRVGWGWRECPVPVIAALHGEVFGGGLQIALGADLRIARPDARLVGHGGALGPDPGHVRQPDAARAGAPRRGAGADLDGHVSCPPRRRSRLAW